MEIGIIGLGLIGGSLGFDLKAKGHRVIGVSRRARTCEIAIERGAVDQASTDLSVLSHTDVVFVCTPIGKIQSTVEQLTPYLKPETIITDVGSVKASVVESVSPLWPNFIGGHPMAGTAYSGIEAALTGLFQGNPYVLTPVEGTPPATVTTLEIIVRDLDANLLHCDPAEHDRAVAWISHLPVMTSASLIAACMDAEPNVVKLAQALASSGFRDTSRVGGGNPELGCMMAEFNQSALLETLYEYRAQLDQLINQIEQRDWAELTQVLEATQRARPAFLKE